MVEHFYVSDKPLTEGQIKDLAYQGVVIKQVSPGFGAPPAPESPVKKKHSHYYRPCPFKTVDVYRVLRLFDITNNEIGHAIKKLLCSGIRGGNKDHDKDVSEAIDTLQRHLEMNQEERDCHAG